MAIKIKTVITYPLSGTTVNFSIPFEYLARKFITVTLIGTTRKELVLNQDYRFTTKNQITTTKAWSTGDGYSLLEVRRNTSATERLVDFADGSILRAYDLNISQVQTLHVAEEARDLTADTIGVNNDGNLDARGRRIVNVADPVDAYDAMNLHTIQSWNDSALTSANRAQSSANSAANSANSAANSATNSSTQADRSRTEADRSANQASIATHQATSATNMATSAAQSAIQSSSSQAQSANQASIAKRWASLDKDNIVDSGEYSAKHYMLYSKDYSDISYNHSVEAKEQAERAKEEADKLGNMNGFAGTLGTVNGDNLSFKNRVDVPILYSNKWAVMENGMAVKGSPIEIYGDTPSIDFHYKNSNNDYSHRIMADTPDHLWFSSGAYFSGIITTDSAINSSAPLNAGLITSQAGKGLHVSAGGSQNNIYITNNAAAGIVSGQWANWMDFQWNSGVVRVGAVSGDTSLHHYQVTVESGTGAVAHYTFNPDGTFQAPKLISGDWLKLPHATIWADGGIESSLYKNNTVKGHLDWLGAQINTRIEAVKRGAIQTTGLLNVNVKDYEVPNGYITGYHNYVNDGNIRVTDWIYRVPQAYSQSRGWFDFANV